MTRQEVIEYFSWHAAVELEDGSSRSLTDLERFDPRLESSEEREALPKSRIGFSREWGKVVREKRELRMETGRYSSLLIEGNGRYHVKGWTSSTVWAG